ncbi:hypothetical protein PMIN04_013076 [Paraphaeosphaeria minitans]|uniref:JmjC domain-containing protein n=1 Tax=Paraphaeosphaeria minitans TaxID=565426 RepID=A0A9P6GE07_9PLEO|nr:hypothetical protein PMIN01_08200 [Paraphaeosphaeria minitans]
MPTEQVPNEFDYDPAHARIRAFRDSLRSLHDEGDKFQACVDMRDNLLDEQADLSMLTASIEEVMSEECAQYKESKGRWASSSDTDAKQWERFIDVASAGASLKKIFLAPLIKAGAFWHADKVRYYGWASAGWKFCKLLGTAASRNPDWAEALVKLNRLILRRIVDGQPLRNCVNPLGQIDLIDLAAWQNKDAYVKKGRNGYTLTYDPISNSQLPAGYAFDRYGLIVCEEVASQSSPSIQAEETCSLHQTESLECDVSMAAPTGLVPDNAMVDVIAPSVPSTPPNAQTSGESTCSTPLTTPLQSPANPSLVESPEDMQLDSQAVSPDIAAPSKLDTFQTSLRASSRLRNQCDRTPVPLIGRVASSIRKGNSQKRKANSRQENDCICICTDTVSPKLISAIERLQQTNNKEDADIAAMYKAHHDALCPKHVKLYALWATTGILRSQPSRDGDLLPASLKILHFHIKPQNDVAYHSQHNSLSPDKSEARPFHQITTDAHFRDQVLTQLEQKTARNKPCKTWGELNAQGMHALLRRARQPATTGAESGKEALFSTSEEAERRLEPHTVLHGPIITENQQQFRWDSHKGRPIEQLFRRMGSSGRSVSVQRSSLSLQQPSFVPMRLGTVRDIFLENKISQDPLNVLDLRNPLPRSILPSFLMGEDCQLLRRIRDTILEGATAERCSAPVAEWNQWRDDEDWALLAQGGAPTLTHQDGCGKATWLTVQEGQVGFGWLSRPSEEEKRCWSSDPNAFEGGQIRYVVLRPGQTVYFEAGTIQFVFRLEQDQTLLLGGHIMRWSCVGSWIQIVLNQLRFPDATNEDLLPAAPAYVEAVAQLLVEQTRLSKSDQLVSVEVIAEFFRVKKASFSQLFRSSANTIIVI